MGIYSVFCPVLCYSVLLCTLSSKVKADVKIAFGAWVAAATYAFLFLHEITDMSDR